MKEMGKKQVKASNSAWMCTNERKALSKMRCPFVLNLKYAFHNDKSLYLVMDMCTGGDLKFHLKAAKVPHLTPPLLSSFHPLVSFLSFVFSLSTRCSLSQC